MCYRYSVVVHRIHRKCIRRSHTRLPHANSLDMVESHGVGSLTKSRSHMFFQQRVFVSSRQFLVVAVVPFSLEEDETKQVITKKRRDFYFQLQNQLSKELNLNRYFCVRLFLLPFEVQCSPRRAIFCSLSHPFTSLT